MASRHLFYSELGKLRKQLEKSVPICYNSTVEVGDLHDPDTESLYDTINGFNPDTVFEYNCGFGLNLVNLRYFLGDTVELIGSMIDDQWQAEGHRHLKINDIATIVDMDHTPPCDVAFIDNDIMRMNRDELTVILHVLKKVARKAVVVKDNTINAIEGFTQDEADVSGGRVDPIFCCINTGFTRVTEEIPTFTEVSTHTLETIAEGLGIPKEVLEENTDSVEWNSEVSNELADQIREGREQEDE